MKKRRLLLILCLLFGLRCASAEVFDTLPRENWYQCPLLRLTAFNAAQSDCLLLECGGESMMVDGGTAAYREALQDALRERGISRLRYLLNTHYHEDHISGLIGLMEDGFAVDEYLHPYSAGSVNGNEYQRAAIRVANERGIPVRQIASGDTLLLGEAVITLYRYDEGLSVNGRSVIARVQMGEASLLLGADIIGDTQSWCLRTLPREMLDADILKAPHHGISVMTSGFLDAVSPELILMTNNRERAAEGEAQAAKYGIPTLYTNEGRVVLETDGTDWYVYQAEGAF